MGRRLIFAVAVFAAACSDAPGSGTDSGIGTGIDASAAPDAEAIETPDAGEAVDAVGEDAIVTPPDRDAAVDGGPGAADAEPQGPWDAGPVTADLDQDGLDDALEAEIMEEYLPFRSIDARDRCPLSAILYRVRPHPDAPDRRIHAIVDVLFERDCGASSHVGDDEVFGMTIDPTLPAPQGILAIRAIAHQNTPCERVTNCGNCPGEQLTACTLGQKRGADYPVVFYSKDKHGSYLDEGICDGACFVTNFCALETTTAEAPMANAGEPNAPMIRNLTAAGVITATAGWTEQELFDFDPWGSVDFGGAGSVSLDLVDDAFLTPACVN